MEEIEEKIGNIGIKERMKEKEGERYLNLMREEGKLDIERERWIGDYNDKKKLM